MNSSISSLQIARNHGLQLLHGVGRERRQQQLLGGLMFRRVEVIGGADAVCSRL